jgi:hypothetical protein
MTETTRRITAQVLVAIETDISPDTIPLYEIREGLEDEIRLIHEIDNSVRLTRVHVTKISEQEA